MTHVLEVQHQDHPWWYPVQHGSLTIALYPAIIKQIITNKSFLKTNYPNRIGQFWAAFFMMYKYIHILKIYIYKYIMIHIEIHCFRITSVSNLFWAEICWLVGASWSIQHLSKWRSIILVITIIIIIIITSSSSSSGLSVSQVRCLWSKVFIGGFDRPQTWHGWTSWLQALVLVYTLHPGKLTWNSQMEVDGRWFFHFKWVVFRFHVNFPGSIHPYFPFPCLCHNQKILKHHEWLPAAKKYDEPCHMHAF